MPKKLEEFIEWTKLKIRIHSLKQREVYFKEKQIWWCSLGVNVGFEQDGKHESFERPVLVLKKFSPNILWIVPLTRIGKISRYYFQLEQGGEDSFVILSQLRVVSSKRLLRKMRTIHDYEFKEIKKRIRKFLS